MDSDSKPSLRFCAGPFQSWFFQSPLTRCGDKGNCSNLGDTCPTPVLPKLAYTFWSLQMLFLWFVVNCCSSFVKCLHSCSEVNSKMILRPINDPYVGRHSTRTPRSQRWRSQGPKIGINRAPPDSAGVILGIHTKCHQLSRWRKGSTVVTILRLQQKESLSVTWLTPSLAFLRA